MGPFGWDRLGLNNAQTVPGGLNHAWACMAKLALWGLKQNFFLIYGVTRRRNPRLKFVFVFLVDSMLEKAFEKSFAVFVRF